MFYILLPGEVWVDGYRRAFYSTTLDSQNRMGIETKFPRWHVERCFLYTLQVNKVIMFYTIYQFPHLFSALTFPFYFNS